MQEEINEVISKINTLLAGDGSRLTLVYTYTLLPNTKQLVVRVSRKAGDRQRAGQDVRLVYRPAK